MPYINKIMIAARRQWQRNFLFAITLQSAPVINPIGKPFVASKKSAVEIVGVAFDTIFNILTLVAGAAAVIYLIWNGIIYLTAGGNNEKTKKARSGIVNAVIGIVIITAAYGIIRFAVIIGNTVNSLVH